LALPLVELLDLQFEGLLFEEALNESARIQHRRIDLYVLLHHEELLSEGHKAHTFVEVVLHCCRLKLIPNLEADAIEDVEAESDGQPKDQIEYYKGHEYVGVYLRAEVLSDFVSDFLILIIKIL
jgi:hypothetical protein